MEKETTTLNDLIENPDNYFVMLTPASKTRSDIYTVELKVEGYRDLFCTIMDLLKAAMLALDGVESSDSNICRDPERYVYSLLRIIEMLIPMEEAELLDKLYRKHLNEKKKSESE